MYMEKIRFHRKRIEIITENIIESKAKIILQYKFYQIKSYLQMSFKLLFNNILLFICTGIWIYV